MVTRRVGRTPHIHMHVLKLRTFGQRRADIHVIELLAIHVEEIGIALRLLDAGHLVKIAQTRLGEKGFERRDEGELIEIACGDHLGVGVLREDGRDEGLGLVSVACACGGLR